MVFQDFTAMMEEDQLLSIVFREITDTFDGMMAGLAQKEIAATFQNRFQRLESDRNITGEDDGFSLTFDAVGITSAMAVCGIRKMIGWETAYTDSSVVIECPECGRLRLHDRVVIEAAFGIGQAVAQAAPDGQVRNVQPDPAVRKRQTIAVHHFADAPEESHQSTDMIIMSVGDKNRPCLGQLDAGQLGCPVAGLARVKEIVPVSGDQYE